MIGQKSSTHLTNHQPYQRLSDVITDRERGWIEMIVIELPLCANSTAGRGLIIHDLLGLPVYAARVSRMFNPL